MTADKTRLFADGLVTVPRAFKELGVHRWELYRWMDEGLPYVQFCKWGLRLIPRRALLDFIQARRGAVAAGKPGHV